VLARRDRHTPNFSLDVVTTDDFTTDFQDEKWTRITVNAGGEFVAGPVPTRLGGWWDSRGRDPGDNRGYVSAGLGYVRPAELGGVGWISGSAFRSRSRARSGEISTRCSASTSGCCVRLRPNL
jgi:hypothetical protein